MGTFETYRFMASITVHCPLRNSDHVYLHGKPAAGHVRYRCPASPHVFQLTYTYEARKLLIWRSTAQVFVMLLASSKLALTLSYAP